LLDDVLLDGKAIKIISMLLGSLPRQHRYRLIFMTRPTAEIAASQQKMIERRQTQGTSGDVAIIAVKLQQHRDEVLKWLESRKFIDLLIVEYPQLVSHPDEQARRVAQFLGPERIPHPERMSESVDPDLYRQKVRIPKSVGRVE
jgi:hypothetical protein